MTSTGDFERAGRAVRTGRRLGQIVARRPPGTTGHQWQVASRARLDFVVGDPRTGRPDFAVVLANPGADAEAARTDRATDAVCSAVGLGLLRVESRTLRPEPHGRRIVEYVLDARAFAAGSADADADADASPSFREIVGRLPDGRDGAVNDLGALARAAAIEAYAGRLLADPLLRGLRVQWRSGPAEGWGWLDVRDGECLFERVVLHPRRMSCGVEPDRFAEDLAALAVGERLRALADGGTALDPRPRLAADLDGLRRRRDELVAPAVDHICL
jgi:hypothetical protein